MSESQLQTTIRKHFQSRGCVVLKLPAGYPGIPVGICDLLILGPSGKWAALEVKAGPKSPYQPLQPQWIDRLDKMGYASRVDPTTWHEIKQEVAAHIL